MFYKSVMAFGVLAMLWSATWFYRVFAGVQQLQPSDGIPLIVGGIAGGIAAWYFVPWLSRYEARRRAAK